MGRHVALDAPEMDRLVDDACSAIGAEIEALHVQKLDGVVLGGGYGRGEGGVKSRGTVKGEWGALSLSNDLDFFAIAMEGSSDADAAAIAVALEPVSRKWTEKLGVDVDFTARTPWRLKHDEERLMVQELVRGYCDVAGAKGEKLFAGIERRPSEAVPWMEAARLLMNRGMGLLFAKRKIESAKCKVGGPSAAAGQMSAVDRDFVNRNINKCILGAGDAFLVSRGLYRWRAMERVDELGARPNGELYARAVEWKFSPCKESVCDWEAARECWLDARKDVMAAVDAEGSSRSIRNAARWLARRRTLGAPGTFGQNPVVRILSCVAHHVETRTLPAPTLELDWKIFN